MKFHSKRISRFLCCCIVCLNLVACSEETVPENQISAEDMSQQVGVDVDLTALSSTMVYSEVYQMMFNMEKYIGKVVKIEGQFMVYTHPDTGKNYYACVVQDALACCTSGIEFVLKDGGNYPVDYPNLQSTITVVGVFRTYEEYGYETFHLTNATFL